MKVRWRMDGRSTSDTESAERFVFSEHHLSCFFLSNTSLQVKSHKAIYCDNTEAAAAAARLLRYCSCTRTLHFGEHPSFFWRIRRANRLQFTTKCPLMMLRIEIRGQKNEDADMGAELHPHGCNYTHICIYIWASNCFVLSTSFWECARAILQCCGCLPSS